MTNNAFKLIRNPENGFCTIGKGSLGGKALGLIRLEALLRDHTDWLRAFPDIQIAVPPTLVIAIDAFDIFLDENQLDPKGLGHLTDAALSRKFLGGKVPAQVRESLARYLKGANYPLAVRSSGLMEDAKNHAYAGLYSTIMLSNDQPDANRRLDLLLQAVKRVYASTFFKGPRAYAKRVGHDIQKDRMAVIVQQVVGVQRGQYCYPDISGVAQSRNYYPLAGIQPDDGLATIAVGFGKQVVSGERALRFSPKYPQRLPQYGTVEDVLAYTQRRFYALPMGGDEPIAFEDSNNLVRRDVNSAADELPLSALAGTYVLSEHRIRDSVQVPGPKVITFAGILKYNQFPLANLLQALLDLGKSSWCVPIEMEFAVNLASDRQPRAQLYLLQLRPMTARTLGTPVTTDLEEIHQAFCYTQHAMGNGIQILKDIVFIKPDGFDPAKTRAIAAEVSQMNARMEKQQRKYLLVGPGRWGSADPWLGIPVRWADISQVGAIVETASDKLKAEPSQGAHFFHNLASLGISYLGVTHRKPDELNWLWLLSQPIYAETDHVAHVRLSTPMHVKVDGRTSRGIIVI